MDIENWPKQKLVQEVYRLSWVNEELMKALEVAYKMLSNHMTSDPSDKYLERLKYIKNAISKHRESREN